MRSKCSDQSVSNSAPDSNEDDQVMMSLASLRELVKNRKPSLTSPGLIPSEFKKRSSVQIPPLNSISQTRNSILTSSSPLAFAFCAKVINFDEASSKSPFKIRVEMSVPDEGSIRSNYAWKKLTECKFHVERKVPIAMELQHSLGEYSDLERNKLRTDFKITIEKIKKEDVFSKKLESVVSFSKLLSNVDKTESFTFKQNRSWGKAKEIRVDAYLRFLGGRQ